MFDLCPCMHVHITCGYTCMCVFTHMKIRGARVFLGRVRLYLLRQVILLNPTFTSLASQLSLEVICLLLPRAGLQV